MESEKLALITRYPDNHCLITRCPDTQFAQFNQLTTHKLTKYAKQTQSKPVLSAACPELAVALSAAEGEVEWDEWANLRSNDCKLLFYRVL